MQETTEDDIGDFYDTPGWDQFYGYGRVNAYNAVNYESLATLNQNETAEIAIYPNPIKGNKLTIENLPIGHYKVYVFNLSGKMVQEFKLDNKQIKYILDVSKIPKGVFMINILGINNQVNITKKSLFYKL